VLTTPAEIERYGRFVRCQAAQLGYWPGAHSDHLTPIVRAATVAHQSSTHAEHYVEPRCSTTVFGQVIVPDYPPELLVTARRTSTSIRMDRDADSVAHPGTIAASEADASAFSVGIQQVL
jgi:hypothetical protein